MRAFDSWAMILQTVWSLWPQRDRSVLARLATLNPSDILDVPGLLPLRTLIVIERAIMDALVSRFESFVTGPGSFREFVAFKFEVCALGGMSDSSWTPNIRSWS